MTKKKKLIISLSVVFGCIVLMLILFWTLFGLSKVVVAFDSTTINLTNLSKEEIVLAGKFDKGESVLFAGKEKYAKNIQQYAAQDKRFAYIKVVNIETVFPNKYVVHIVEREELFGIEYGEQYLICDRDLRVLKIVDTLIFEDVIVVENMQILTENPKEGDFLKAKQQSLSKFCSAMIANNRSVALQLAKFDKITFSDYVDDFTGREYVQMSLQTTQGRKFVVKNIDFALKQKIQKMFAVEAQLFDSEVDENGKLLDAEGKIRYVVKNEDGVYVNFDVTEHDPNEKLALSMSLLAGCYIAVDNLTLTDYLPREETDIYSMIVSNEPVEGGEPSGEGGENSGENQEGTV